MPPDDRVIKRRHCTMIGVVGAQCRQVFQCYLHCNGMGGEMSRKKTWPVLFGQKQRYNFTGDFYQNQAKNWRNKKNVLTIYANTITQK